MTGMRIRVELVKRGDKAAGGGEHRVLLREYTGPTNRPVHKAADLQPGVSGVSVYVTPGAWLEIESACIRATGNTGESVTAAQYVSRRIVGDYLAANGPTGAQAVALESLHGTKALRSDSRQPANGRRLARVELTPQQHGQLELLAKREGWESVADLLSQVISDWVRDHGAGGDLGAKAMQALYGPRAPMAKEARPGPDLKAQARAATAQALEAQFDQARQKRGASL